MKNDVDGTVVPTSSIAERDRRWSLAREVMEREALDALLVSGEHEDACLASAYDRVDRSINSGG